MSSHTPVMLAAEVHQDERPALNEAAAMLGKCFAELEKPPRPVSLQFLSPGAVPESTPACIILSFLPEVARANESISETERRWREHLTKLQSSEVPILIMTVFRHVRERNREGVIAPLLERIRRLNRMAADLSHDLGIGVIDIDRALAHVGGRVLDTDYRLTGAAAFQLAGHTIAKGLLSFGLDDVIDPALQEKASAILGNLEKMSFALERKFLRERAKRRAGPSAGTA